MACECGHIGKSFLVNIEVCQECEPDRIDALERLTTVVQLKWGSDGTIWIQDHPDAHAKPWNPSMPVRELATILTSIYGQDITNTVFELKLKR